MSVAEDVLISEEKLVDFLCAAFSAAGLNSAEAGIVATALASADLRGMHSHGAVRMPIYIAKILEGGFSAGSSGQVLRDAPSVQVIDAKNGLGQVFAARAMDVAIEKARHGGIGACGVLNSNHFGEGAPYVLRAVAAGMIGLIFTNCGPVMPVWGGRSNLTGPLPITAAAPAGDRYPFVIDAALGASSRGKLLYAAANGRKVSHGVGVDSTGRPTDDPRAILDGGWIVPIGEHKGWGIIMLVEILAGVLTGGAIGNELRDLMDPDRSSNQGLGHFAIAVDITRFLPLEVFKARMDEFIAQIKLSERADGVAEIFIPGEIEFRREAERRRDGVPLGRLLVAELDALAEKLGVIERLGSR